MVQYLDTVAESVRLNEAPSGKLERDIVDPENSNVFLRNFGENFPSQYASADAAYAAWCAELGITSYVSGSDYAMSESAADASAQEFINLYFAAADGGSGTYVHVSRGAGVGLHKQTISDLSSGTYGNLTVTSKFFTNHTISTQRPLFMLTVTNQFNYDFDIKDFKIRRMKLIDGTDEAVMIFSRVQQAGVFPTYITRMAFRLRHGFYHMVATSHDYDQPSGLTPVHYYTYNQATDDGAVGKALIPDFSGTVEFYGDDLGAEHPYVSEYVYTADAHSAGWRLRSTLADQVKTQPTVAPAWGQVLASTIGLAPVLAKGFKPGANVEDVVALALALEAVGRLSSAASDALRVADVLRLTRMMSLAESLGLASSVTSIRGAFVVDQLRLIPSIDPDMKYGVALLQAMRFSSSLGNFFGADMSDVVRFAPVTTRILRVDGTLMQGVGVSAALASRLVLRLVLAETVDVADAEVLSMLFVPEVAERIEISAAYIQNGEAVTTWVVNTRTGATTEYSNYDFNSFAMLGRKYIGASAQGLYELVGDTDAGTVIISEIKSGFAQFSGAKFSSFKAAYLGVRGAGDFVFRVLTGDDKYYNYAVTAKSMESTKIHIGKGLRARYFAFELISTGQDFDLDTVEFIPLTAQRRV